MSVQKILRGSMAVLAKDTPAEEEPQTKASPAVSKTPEAGADGDAIIFGTGRG